MAKCTSLEEMVALAMGCAPRIMSASRLVDALQGNRWSEHAFRQYVDPVPNVKVALKFGGQVHGGSATGRAKQDGQSVWRAMLLARW